MLRLERATRIAQEHALKLFGTNEMLLQRMPIVLTSGHARRLEEAVRQQREVLPKPCSAAVLAGG